MNDIAFCSVAFTNQRRGDGYIKQQVRLKKSLMQFYPEKNLFFFSDTLPEGARPQHESMYGFKPHACWYAMSAGFKKICWIDTAMILNAPLEYEQSLIAVKDDSDLTNLCSNRALTYFNIQRSVLKDIPFVGGSFYYFDLNDAHAKSVLCEWREMERFDYFGSQAEEASNPGLQGHRHDETIMSLLMWKNGFKPLTYDEAGYNSKHYPVMNKYHFEDKQPGPEYDWN